MKMLKILVTAEVEEKLFEQSVLLYAYGTGVHADYKSRHKKRQHLEAKI